MIGRLLCKGSMTGAIMNDVIDENEEIFQEIVGFFRKKVQKFIASKNLSEDLESVKLLRTFDIENPYEELRDLDQQIKALKERCNYIEPIEIPLDYRMDNTLNRETGTFMPKRVLDTCQYVPVIETLKLVLSNRHVF